MATITASETPLLQSGGKGILHFWEAIGDGDVCAHIERNGFADRSIQVLGTLGGGTIVIEGSNDGVNFVTLFDLQGVALSFSGAGLKGIAEITRYVRPALSGSTGADVDVYMFGRRD